MKIPSSICAVIICIAISTPLQVTISHSESTLAPQPCTQVLTLTKFRALALAKSPLVATIDSDYANELANAFEKQVLANPVLEVEQTFTGMRLNGDNDPQTQLSVGLPLKISNFGQMDKIAALIRKSAGMRQQAQILEFTQTLILQFRTLFFLSGDRKVACSS
jgi:hypothetical protein